MRSPSFTGVSNHADPDYVDSRYQPALASPRLYNEFSSRGTPTTATETSPPLSSVNFSPGAHHGRIDERGQIYDKYKERSYRHPMSQSQKKASLHGKKSLMMHYDQLPRYSTPMKIDKFENYKSEIQKLQTNRKKHSNVSQRLNTLSWRMDPAESLSDYTLMVVGINDEDAIKNRRSDGSERKKRSQRREKWIVDGLYLDASQSKESVDEYCDDDLPEEARDVDHTFISSVTGRPYSLSLNKNQTKLASDHPTRKEYYLHKVNLAVGPRSCEYFARLFRQQQQQAASNGYNTVHPSNCHSIELPLSSLPAIPSMLDFIYSTDGLTPVQATTETAVPLRYLATIFGNRSLFDSATEYLQADLRPETAIPYLNHADLYRQKKLSEVCVRLCAEQFDHIKIRWLAMLPPHLMEEILYSKYFQCSSCNQVCSKIAAYCRCHGNAIDSSSFLSLTDARVMPLINPEEALFFIKFMISLGINLDDDEHDLSGRNLYERCIDAAPSVVRGVIDSLCHGTYSYGSRRQDKNSCGDYRQLPPHIKVDLLEYALARQQHGEI